MPQKRDLVAVDSENLEAALGWHWQTPIRIQPEPGSLLTFQCVGIIITEDLSLEDVC